MKRNPFWIALVSAALCLLLAAPALADVEISGTQTRGQGKDGVLRGKGVKLKAGGTITRVIDSGAGFWLQSDKGHLLKFQNAKSAIGTVLPAATWYAYPNLYRDADQAAVTVYVQAGGSGGTGASGAILKVAGRFKCRDGIMVFQQKGRKVTGTYDWSGGGTVTGVLDGTTLTGVWADKAGKGQVRFEFTADGTRYEHVWKYDADSAWRSAGPSLRMK